MAATLCACGNSGGRALATANDIYAMGAVSTVKLLGSNLSSDAMRTLTEASVAATADSSVTAGTGDDGVKNQIDKFNEYFAALDSFLGEDVVTSVSQTNTDAEYAEYETKLTITGKDIEGKTVAYTMYFTETFVSEEYDHDETKSEYRLQGVLVYGEQAYNLTGKRSEETERSESENEIKIRAYIDDNTYVEMEHEYSVENNETETEYVYSLYRDGILVEKTEVEFETERKGSKQETEYSIEFVQGGAKGKYKVERVEKNGEVRMRVTYNLDGKKGEFTIRERLSANGEKQYEYTFSDKSTKLCKA